jgi:tetratricopeptide (TPR) repeat protein
LATSGEEKKKIEISKELAGKFAAGHLTIGQLVGLTSEACYEIAQVGYNYLQTGAAHKALDIYQGLVAVDPGNAVFHCHLAATHVALEELDPALGHYAEAIRLDGTNVDALAGRGELHLRMKKLKEAVSDLAAAVKADGGKKQPSAVRAASILMMLNDRVKEVAKPGPAASKK